MKIRAGRKAVNNTELNSFSNTGQILTQILASPPLRGAEQNERLYAAGTAEAALVDEPYDNIGVERDELFARFLAERKALAGPSSRFILDFFNGRSTSPVCIASYSNVRGEAPPKHYYGRDPIKIGKFVSEYDVPGRAIYFAVSTIKPGQKRDKANADELLCLHADLDFKGIVEGRKQIEAVIDGLPLLPQLVNFSGHGLHTYFVFPEALKVTPEMVERIEAALKRLPHILAADLQVAEVARVMRLPGSHNSKNGEWTECTTIRRREGFWTLEQLEEWLAKAKPLLTRKPKDNDKAKAETKTSDTKADCWDRYLEQFHEPIDIDTVLDAMEFGGTNNDGVDISHFRIVGSMLIKGEQADDIVDFLVKETWERIPESRGWSKQKEISKLRDMVVRTFKKRPELIEQQATTPKWLKSTFKEIAKLADEQIISKDVDMVCAADVKMRPKEWIWKGHLLRGALELLTGIPGLGKSQVQCHFVACVTNGKLWPDGAAAIAPANVIMVTAEDALDTEVVPRLTAAGADLKRVFFLKCIKTDKKTKRQFMLSEDLVRLERKVVEIGNVGLISIDPITAYMGGKVDSHKTTEVRSQLGPLKDFAEHINIAISAITHPPKHSSNRAIDHFIGSQAFIAAARIGHACFEEMVEDGEDGEKRPTGRILFTNAKYNAYTKMPTLAFRVVGILVNDNTIETSHVVWDSGAVDISADQAIASSKPKPKRNTEREEASDRVVVWLRDFLKDGPREQTEIVKQGSALGYSRNQLRTAREKLGIVPKKKGFVGPWMWDLPRAKNGIVLRYN